MNILFRLWYNELYFLININSTLEHLNENKKKNKSKKIVWTFLIIYYIIFNIILDIRILIPLYFSSSKSNQKITKHVKLSSTLIIGPTLC